MRGIHRTCGSVQVDEHLILPRPRMPDVISAFPGGGYDHRRLRFVLLLSSSHSEDVDVCKRVLNANNPILCPGGSSFRNWIIRFFVFAWSCTPVFNTSRRMIVTGRSGSAIW